jgi:chromosome segregation ATPase
MSLPSSEISSFRLRTRLFGYERKATDEFLKHVAELVQKAQERIEQVETELAEHRQKESSLNEVLLSAARVMRDARLEEERIRTQARNLKQVVATTRTQLTMVLRETLQKLEQVPDEIGAGRETEQGERNETLEALDLACELAPSVASAEERSVEQRRQVSHR